MNWAKTKKIIIASLAVNAIIAILGTIAIIRQIIENSMNTDPQFGTLSTFRYFTNDGNIYCVIASIVMLVLCIMSLVKKDFIKSKIAYAMKLASAVSGAIIFLVVMFILLPQYGISLLSGYTMMVLHVINPLLAIASFIVLDRTPEKLSLKETVYGSLPVFVYAFFALTLCISKVWTGEQIPYSFLDVYHNSLGSTLIYSVGILGGSWGLSVLFCFLNNKIQK